MSRTFIWIAFIALAITTFLAVESPDIRSRLLHPSNGGPGFGPIGLLIAAILLGYFRSRSAPPTPDTRRRETQRTIKTVSIWLAGSLLAVGAALLIEKFPKTPSKAVGKPPVTSALTLFPVKAADGQFGYVDILGNYVIHPQFHDAYPFSEGVAVVGVALRRYGFIDQRGRFMIDAQFVSAADFHEGLAAICDTQRLWGFIDRKGISVIPPQFEEVRAFRNRVALVKAAGKWGLVDRQGRYIVRPAFDYGPNGWPGSGDLSAGPMTVVAGRLTGYIGTDGRFVITPRFAAASGFFEGVAAVSVDNRTWGYIAEDGSTVIQPQLEYAEDFHEGLAAVKTEGKWGFIDHSGKLVISPLYARVRPFAEGVAAVQIDHRWGYVDRSGVVVISPKFWSDDFAQNEGGDWSFHGGAAEVYVAGKTRGYMNHAGQIIAVDGK